MLWKLVENVKYEDIYEVKRRQTASASVFFFFTVWFIYITTKMTLYLVVI